MAQLTALERSHLGDIRPDLLQLLLQVMERAEAQLGFTVAVPVDGGVRTNARQAQLYADSLAQGGGVLKYPVATPGTGRHEYGAAVDLHIVAGGSGDDGRGTRDDYQQLADVAEALGLVAGFYFVNSDPYHFQLAEPLDESQARWAAMHNAGPKQLLFVLAIAAAGLALLSHRQN